MENLKLLISEEEIKHRIAEIAAVLDVHYAGREVVILMVMKGAICLGVDLMRALKTPFTVELIKASSYGNLGTQRGTLSIEGFNGLDITSKEVLLVDDIYDSGNTLSKIVANVREKKPKSLHSLVLLSKKVKRDSAYIPDHVLFEIENVFVVGFGLDYKEHYRGLRGVYALNAG